MKRSSNVGNASGGAYKPVATGGGETEMTELGGPDEDIDAEYGEIEDDDVGLGSPGALPVAQ
jgi:hypothetical protein